MNLPYRESILNINTILILLFSIVIQITLSAQTKFSENDYADYIQILIGGEREYSVQSGRVDLLLPEIAFEIEWANKWKDAIGQSIWYSLQTERQPGIILILRKKEDYKYFIQLNSALAHAKLQDEIKVLLFPQDFEELIKK